jgi:hypothetical protein
LIYELTGNKSVLSQLTYVPDLQPEPRWTMQEAEAMANRQERLCYSRFNNNLNGFIRQFIETRQQITNPLSTNTNGLSKNKRRKEKRYHANSSASSSSLVNCPYCNVNVKFINLESHKTNKCPKRPV